jgi:hypothetical protein
MEDEAGDTWAETWHLAYEYVELWPGTEIPPSQSLDDVKKLTRRSLTDIVVRHEVKRCDPI